MSVGRYVSFNMHMDTYVDQNNSIIFHKFTNYIMLMYFTQE